MMDSAKVQSQKVEPRTTEFQTHIWDHGFHSNEGRKRLLRDRGRDPVDENLPNFHVRSSEWEGRSGIRGCFERSVHFLVAIVVFVLVGVTYPNLHLRRSNRTAGERAGDLHENRTH